MTTDTDKTYFSTEELTSFAPARVESSEPYTIRIAQYPDGRQVIQGGYSWSQGWKSGITWKDLPVILIDDNGIEQETDFVD